MAAVAAATTTVVEEAGVVITAAVAAPSMAAVVVVHRQSLKTAYLWHTHPVARGLLVTSPATPIPVAAGVLLAAALEATGIPTTVTTVALAMAAEELVCRVHFQASEVATEVMAPLAAAAPEAPETSLAAAEAAGVLLAAVAAAPVAAEAAADLAAVAEEAGVLMAPGAMAAAMVAMAAAASTQTMAMVATEAVLVVGVW